MQNHARSSAGKSSTTFQTDPGTRVAIVARVGLPGHQAAPTRFPAGTERLPPTLSGNPRSPVKTKTLPFPVSGFRPGHFRAKRQKLSVSRPTGLAGEWSCPPPHFQIKHGIDFAECTALKCRPSSTVATRSCCVGMLPLLRAYAVRHCAALLQIHQRGTLSGRADC